MVLEMLPLGLDLSLSWQLSRRSAELIGGLELKRKRQREDEWLDEISDADGYELPGVQIHVRDDTLVLADELEPRRMNRHVHVKPICYAHQRASAFIDRLERRLLGAQLLGKQMRESVRSTFARRSLSSLRAGRYRSCQGRPRRTGLVARS